MPKTNVQNSPEMDNSEMSLEVILFQVSNKTGQKQIDTKLFPCKVVN